MMIPANQANTMSRLKDAVADYADVKIFKKTSDGMFDDANIHKKDLENYLSTKNVGILIITGANGGACVQQSIIGALKGDCTVVAYEKGIADFNYADYIYPYTGKYEGIKPSCHNCAFSEITNVDNLDPYIVNKANVVNRTPLNSGSVR